MITIAEMEEYRKKANKLLPNEKEQKTIIDYLSKHPKSGEIMQETGGVRKLRWALPGGGKRGGVRIIYYYHDERMPLYLFTMFGKSEKDNLTDKEKKQLKTVIKNIVKAHGL